MVKTPKEKVAKLKVAEAMQEDTYKGIVRVDSGILKELGIRAGSVVKIESKDRASVALVDRALPSDLGLPIIRMDGLIRRNSGTSIGEYAFVKAADIKEAKTVTIAPARKGVIIQGHPMTFQKSLLGRPVMKGDVISMGGARARRRTLSGSPFEDIFNMFGEDLMSGFGGFGVGGLKFVIVNANPSGAVLITQNTQIEVKSQAVTMKNEHIPDITYEDIGGLKEEIIKVREMIEIPLKHPEVFERLGVQPPKGVLLRGPPGTGKTLIAKAVANESGAHFISINGPEIVSKFVGEAEKNLRKLFDDAEKNAPAIIFIDEIDAIAPKREESYGEVERRIVAQLLALMDGLKGRGKVIVIAATNRPDALDPALRRGGRFDREIEIGVPSKAGRLQILKIHTRNMPLSKGVNVEELANVTHGFVGADIESLCKEAAMSVLRREMPELSAKEKDEKIPQELLDKLRVKKQDFKDALKLVSPSAMREVLIETPNVHWTDIGDLDDAKQEIKEAVEWPLQYPESFTNLGIKPPRGILLYGPPGCGKTMLVKAAANESDANFISIKGPELLSKWVGESEKGVRKIFQKAKQVSPTIIFFDEVDALAPKRGHSMDSGVTERVVSQILTEIDGMEELADVVIIAATNRPELVDPALLRPGRFDRFIYIKAPTESARRDILAIHTKSMPLASDVNLVDLARHTINFSGADLKSLCSEAAMIALRENIDAKIVGKKHFAVALKKVGASLDEKDSMRYKKIIKDIANLPDYMG
jgi:transitional endoplasmic reticulum ATPase